MPFSLFVPLPDLSIALFSLSLSVLLFLTLSVPLSLLSLIFGPLNSGACLPTLLLCRFIVESTGFCLGSLPCVVPCKHFKALNCGGYRVHLICFPYILDIYLTGNICGEKDYWNSIHLVILLTLFPGSLTLVQLRSIS